MANRELITIDERSSIKHENATILYFIVDFIWSISTETALTCKKLYTNLSLNYSLTKLLASRDGPRYPN